MSYKKLINFIIKHLNLRRNDSSERVGYSPLSKAIIKKYNLTRESEITDILCHAPTKSMRFTYEGKSIVCCHNHSHVIGHYPTQSIHNIWFSKEAERLRNLIKRNDLSSGCNSRGCESCAKMLTTGRYYHALARDFDYLPDNSNQYPSLMEFELDTTCNLACIMCSSEFSSSIRKKLNVKKPAQFIYTTSFIDQLEEFIPHLHETRFYGGEPFVIPIHFEIWDRIIRINPNSLIFVQSNGTILNDRIKELLEKGKFLISLSIDSFVEKTYESIRINSSYKKMIRNFNYFLDYSRQKNLQMTVVICPMRQNWQEIPEIVRYCNDENIKLSFTTVLRPSECALWNLTSDELKEVSNVFDKFKYSGGNVQQNENIENFTLLKEEIANWIVDAKNRKTKINQKINSKNIQQLKQEFLNRIRDHIIQDSELSNSSYERLNMINSKVEQIFNNVESDFTLVYLLKQAQLSSIDEIIGTIENRELSELQKSVMDKSLSRDNYNKDFY